MMKRVFNYIDKFKIKFYDPYQRANYYKNIGVKFGENCQVFANVGFGSEPYLISTGNNVKITAGTQFITHDGGVEVLRNMKLLKNADIFGEIKIGNNVFIGNRCIILPNITIGDNVVIGAGSVVTKNIPSNTVCAGVPAKFIKSIEDYYKNLEIKVDYTKNMKKEEKKQYLLKKYNIK